jgi:predicted DNA-binding antitoxin AbrB/MazE fold protein
MSLQVDATYENGILKLDEPLPLTQGARVRVVLQRIPRTGPLFEWKGSIEDLDYLTESADNLPEAVHDDDFWQSSQR